MAKGKKPQAAPEAVQEQVTETVQEQVTETVQEQPKAVGTYPDGTEHNERKPFAIPRRYAQKLDGKKGLVVSGFAKEPIDGHYPHISVHNIAKALGLDLREYAQCDERQTDVVVAAQEAGLEIIGVTEYQGGVGA